MARETEHKYLVRGDDWRRSAVRKTWYRQGYLSTNLGRSVRVRARESPTARAAMSSSPRFQIKDAEEMLERPLREKTRHVVEHERQEWEVDEFHGASAGLLVAELETASLVHLPYSKWGRRSD